MRIEFRLQRLQFKFVDFVFQQLKLSSDSILRLSDLISLIIRKTTVERKIIPIAVSGIKTSFDMSVILVILLLFGYAALYTIYCLGGVFIFFL